MKSRYICSSHTAALSKCESYAARRWSHMMQRALRALKSCRTDATSIYFNAALDIALIRNNCEFNVLFNNAHITSPLSYLIQLHLAEEDYNRAIALLFRISGSAEHNKNKLNASLWDFIAQQYKRIELAEKEVYSNNTLDENALPNVFL